ncbi:phage tail tape measure protein [Clostridium perfringens]|uniref:phage tail tape measure protein n=1 Tax=Clostridium perfringens TaxID=1502 RepID=UPI002B20C19E|nr:phage tail tape measure protein [Clostridium perfringens]MEA5268950.1 phage tail tape measure protein [Clostridium perfringens]MEA5271594.1 phage tail tape measure protein [Clostridium perfringens]MEA5342110.1 phage tail tape measure protein [Clostridium perfringens]MEA5380640.1 phage tail tape measure protein [Clostridium perfringens]
MSDLEKRITAKMVLDDSGYSNTLKGINATLRENKSELKAATSGLNAFGKSTSNVERVQRAFKDQLETQAKKVKVYKDSLKKANDTLEKNVATRSKLVKSISQEEAKLSSLKKKYGENNDAVRNVEKRLEEYKEKLEKVDSSIESNSKRIQSYSTQLNNAEAELNKATSAAKKFNDEVAKNNGLKTTSKKLEEASSNFKKFGEGAKKVGSSLTTHVTLPLAGVAAASTAVGMEFEAQMDKVSAISGATGEDFKKLKSKAEEMGAKTKFSASEAGQGLEYMAMAGWKTGDMLNGIEPILNLAIASGEELGTTSDIVTDALTAFGLTAKDAGMFSDVLAAASSNANTNVGMMGETFKYAAPVCGALGYNAKDTALAIGLMANSGIKASQAGTALRAGLTNLVKPTDSMAAVMDKYGISLKDSNGNMKSFKTVMEDLRTKFGKLDKSTQAAAVSTLFGKEAMSGWLAIINASSADFDKLSGAIDKSEGATAQMAKTMSENAKGSIAEMKSALEGAAIKVFEALAPSITKVANAVSDLATKFSNLSPETQEFIVKAGLAAMAAGPLISGVGKLSTGIGGVLKFGSLLTKGIGAVTTGAEVLTGVTGAVGVAAEGTAVATGAAGTAVAGFGAVASSVLLPLAGVVAVVGAVGYAGYKTAKYLSEDATPAVDLFADKAVYSTETIATSHGKMTMQIQTDTIKISESTKENVQSYLDMDKKASNSLMELRMNSDKFTKEAKDTVLKNFEDMSKKSSELSDEQRNAMTVNFKKLVSDTGILTQKNKDEIIKQYTAMVNGTKNLTAEQKQQTIKDFTDTLNQSVGLSKKQSAELQKIYKDMSEKIKAGMDKKREEELKKQKEFFDKSNALSEKEEAEAIKKTGEFWEKQKSKIDEGQKRIEMIYQKAAEEHRQITEDEFKAISSIQHGMKEDAIKTLSDNEVEAKVILERMKGNDERITAEQASQHIKELNKSRDEAIKAANEECDKRIAEIIRMRDETGTLTAEQADKCIEDAKRQRDETVSAAEETRNQAVDKIASMNSNIRDSVNTTTGEVKSNWDKLKDWWDNWHPVKKIFEVFTKHTSDGKSADQNWTGNSYFRGGFTTLHERGYELYDLPSGTKIYNHESSEAMVLETAKQTAQIVAESMLDNQEGSRGDIVIPISIAGEEIDRIVVPRVSNKLARNSRRGGR